MNGSEDAVRSRAKQLEVLGPARRLEETVEVDEADPPRPASKSSRSTLPHLQHAALHRADRSPCFNVRSPAN